MKATITLKDGRTFSGVLESVNSERICIDFEKLNADAVNAMQKTGFSITHCPDKTWYVIARFDKIEKYEIVD